MPYLSRKGRDMHAADVLGHFKQTCPFVNWDNTVDTFKAGNPEREVTRAAVAWMSTLEALQHAVRNNCDLFITHEPTFYDHWDRDVPELEGDGLVREKRRLLDDSGLVVLRLHDSWDRFPGLGVRDTWLAQLGFPAEKCEELPVISLDKPMRLAELAGLVAASVAFEGERLVRLAGDPSQEVRRLYLGIGATGGLRGFVAARREGADAIVANEVCQWKELRWAQDAGLGVILLDHSTTEERAVRNLADYLRDSLALETLFIPTASPYLHYSADGPVEARWPR